MVGGLSSDQVSVMSRPGQPRWCNYTAAAAAGQEEKEEEEGTTDRLELELQRMTALFVSN